ncbi:lytic murein transglycosylase [Fodinibius sediminis]|uniref:Transglycosylase SLT domain-containing protein n=1 Tax=Fodinibius sediminis TaxID=1214077 RepID=A0A521DGP7_9BACT|nr:lytic murein transglycosylase [Fodinibius sediminis]SMO70796.1 Transglycosylase SLT domain-containing protein [Fodinibius sediminis]
MTIIASVSKKSSLLIMLLAWAISSAQAHSFAADKPIPASPAGWHASPDTLSLPAHSNYESSLSALLEACRRKGYEIEPLLRDDRFEIYEGIGDRFRKSAERKSINLEEYKKILGFDDKRDRGADFIRKHADQLQKAQEKYGIPKYVIAAIIGIESDFGQNIGSYNPFNAYVSMYAVDYRADFAKAQLLELLDFTQRNSIDVFELKSSYAGAMSFAQFIPYSLNKWFVGDDIFDMDNNIMSVANYLAYFQQRTNSLRTSVLRYNPSGLYADAVMDLAKEVELATEMSATH